MNVKKSYLVGDDAWVYGINRSNTKPVKGKVIKIVDIEGFAVGPHYIIEIPTHIDSLLEIRTWESMSQDEHGPVGSLRLIGNIESTIKFAGRVGFVFDDNPESETEEDGPTAEEIHAALEKSQKDIAHAPLNLKPTTKKRRTYRKKKQQ